MQTVADSEAAGLYELGGAFDKAAAIYIKSSKNLPAATKLIDKVGCLWVVVSVYLSVCLPLSLSLCLSLLLCFFNIRNSFYLLFISNPSLYQLIPTTTPHPSLGSHSKAAL